MNNPDESNRPAEADARAALSRLADHANTQPTRPLGTYEMATEQAGSGTGERFEWRRLAVAAAIVALVGGGVVALNLRSSDSSIQSAPVDPIQSNAQQPGAISGATASLRAGFIVAGDLATAPANVQRQYAADQDRPETGRYMTVTALSGPFEGGYTYTIGDFYPQIDLEPAGAVPPTLDPATTVTAESFSTAAPNEPATTDPEMPIQCAEGVDAPPTSTNGVGADDRSVCPVITIIDVDGQAVMLVASGLSVSEVTNAAANIVPAPDGFGYSVHAAAMPNGLSEIASGAITTMFEPRSAVDATTRVALGWTPGSSDPNPVLDSAGVQQAKILAIADGGTGLAGQRLGVPEVRDAVVGGDAAVVQIAESSAMRVVWRHEGSLFMYEETGTDLNPDATVQRANELAPFIVADLADGVDSVDSPTTTTLPSGCYNGYPTTVQEERGGTTLPLEKCLGIPESTWVVVTLPEPTTEPTSGPTTTEPDHHTPTTDQGVPTTATLPRPPFDGTSPNETTTIPDWTTPTPTTEAPPYPGPSDTSGTTTTYPDYTSGPSPTTTYPGVPSTVPYPGPSGQTPTSTWLG